MIVAIDSSCSNSLRLKMVLVEIENGYMNDPMVMSNHVNHGKLLIEIDNNKLCPQKFEKLQYLRLEKFAKKKILKQK